MTSKINFKQPKYIFPLVIFVPLCALIYFVMETFKGNDDGKTAVATDRINMELPEARPDETGDKLLEMERRFGEEDAYTAVGSLGDDEKDTAQIDHAYSEAELNRIDAAEAERLRQQQELEDLEKSLAESRKHINAYAYGDGSGGRSSRSSSGSSGYSSQEDFARDMEQIQRRSYERQRAIEDELGLGQDDREEALQRQRADSVRKAKKAEAERNRPKLVIKSPDTNAEKFNTVGRDNDLGFTNEDNPLIRAMIDQTTKAREGTRLRFKLLDNVMVNGQRLPKGTYLYGTVTGFGSQRVRAAVTSILVGGKFLRVNLSVFDNDGMEGFYVPESMFRDMMKDASANVVQQNLNIDSNTGYGSGISGEALALQALQNIYNSASSAVSNNIRRNKARIKYNTIVYLINSDDAR